MDIINSFSFIYYRKTNWLCLDNINHNIIEIKGELLEHDKRLFSLEKRK